MTATSASTIAQIRTLAADGLARHEIAAALGIGVHKVNHIVGWYGIPVRRLTSAERSAITRRAVRVTRQAIVPGWVPADLRSDYRDLAADLGPDWADRAVRRLMEDAR